MYSDWIWSAIGGFLATWLLVLTFLVWQQGNFLKSLFPKFGERDIRKKFEEIVKIVEGFRADLTYWSTKPRIATYTKSRTFAFQSL